MKKTPAAKTSKSAPKKTKGKDENAYTYVTPRETELKQKWKKEGKSKADIIRLTGRSKECVNLHLHGTPEKVGRKKIITTRVFRKLRSSLKQLQRKAKARKEVTVAMITKHAKVEVSDRCALDAFHKDGTYFKPLTTSPILSKDDIAARKVWAEEYKGRTASTWLTNQTRS